jgi:hypothetical protein
MIISRSEVCVSSLEFLLALQQLQQLAAQPLPLLVEDHQEGQQAPQDQPGDGADQHIHQGCDDFGEDVEGEVDDEDLDDLGFASRV